MSRRRYHLRPSPPGRQSDDFAAPGGDRELLRTFERAEKRVGPVIETDVLLIHGKAELSGVEFEDDRAAGFFRRVARLDRLLLTARGFLRRRLRRHVPVKQADDIVTI